MCFNLFTGGVEGRLENGAQRWMVHGSVFAQLPALNEIHIHRSLGLRKRKEIRMIHTTERLPNVVVSSRSIWSCLLKHEIRSFND